MIARFFESYLVAYLFFAELSLGSMALLMIYQLTGGVWGEKTKTILEASTRNVPLAALLFIPVALGAKTFYPWLITPPVGHQALYLHYGGFLTRAAFYLVGWSVLSWLVVRGRTVAAPGLVFYGITATFAAIDWQMSLEPHWYSTVYGLVFLVGQALGAWAFTLLIYNSRPLAAEPASDPETEARRGKAYRDMGNIFLALVMLWAYLSFMQYLIIWSGDLPEEVSWLNHRMQHGWQYVALILICFQFAAPFLFLLSRSLKTSRSAMRWLCVGVLFIRMIDRYWMVMPALHPSPRDFSWFIPAALLVVGLAWLPAFFTRKAGSDA